MYLIKLEYLKKKPFTKILFDQIKHKKSKRGLFFIVQMTEKLFSHFLNGRVSFFPRKNCRTCGSIFRAMMMNQMKANIKIESFFFKNWRRSVPRRFPEFEPSPTFYFIWNFIRLLKQSFNFKEENVFKGW